MMLIMIDDLWIKIFFFIYFLIFAFVIGVNSKIFKKVLKKITKDKRICLVLTLQESEILRNLCMEVLGNYKWKTGRKKALMLNKINPERVP